MSTKDFADVVILGSGASGAAAAWSLSRNTSLRIVCLEQGRSIDKSKYPTTSSDWELGRYGDFSPFPRVRNSTVDYPIDDSGSPISIAQFNGVGGSTILYSGHFPRFRPSDFKVNTVDGVADDWPIDYSDLEPFFEENEKIMGVAGMVGDPAYPSYHSLLPPVPLGEMGKSVAQAFNKLGWHWWPSYSAIYTKKYNPFDELVRSPCLNLGPCNTGCPQSAKGSVDVTYLPLAIANGVEIYTECRACEIVLNKDGVADGVVYVDSHGVEKSIEAGVVIVACSGIGTPRLLLNSKSSLFPNGLLNNNDLVGRYLTLHPLAYTEGVFKEDLKSSLGPHGCCLYSQEFYETREEHNFVRGYTMHILRGATPIESAISGYFMRRLALGKSHHSQFNKHFNHTAGIAVIAEDLPDANNRVELDYSNKDTSGMPGVKIHYKMNENTENILKHGMEKSKELLLVADADIVSSFAPVKNTGWHTSGTVRMGENPNTSVVNKYGQAHEVENLFVVDSSIFVTAGAVNPVATAQALTLFCCDYISSNFDKITKGV